MSKSLSAASSAVIVVGIRWTDRLIGVVSTVILARMLAPEDFGIIAMASLLIGLIDVLLDMGVNITLIQNKDASQDDFDAAWTLRLIQSCVATLIIFIAAYPAADYFHDAKVTPVIQVLALSVLILGLENIGIVVFQKKMEFGQEFRFFFYKRVGGFLITMVAAWVLHSYWALVIGTLAVRFIGLALSYSMHPMRPRFSMIRMKAMLSFSSWNLMTGISGYLNASLHRLLVGRREDSAVMGAYTLASDISAMPSSELLAPLNRVLFPMFVEAKDDSEKFKRLFLLAMGVQAIIGIPAGLGLACVAHELVLAMLGVKWIAAVPFVQIMGGINVVLALSASGGYVLLTTGRAKIIALHSWGQVLMFVLGAWLVFPNAGSMEIAQIRAGVAATGLFTFVYLIRQEHPRWHKKEMLSSVWRPFVAGIVMTFLIWAMPPMPHISVTLLLFFKTSVGVVTYALTLVFLWKLSGCPDGAETYLLGKARPLIAMLQRKRRS